MQTTETVAKTEASGKVRSFDPAQALAWFSADILKFEDASRFVAKLLHPEGPHCPTCGAAFTDDRRKERWYRFERIQCPECKVFCTAATGTILHKSEFESREIVLFAVLLELGISDKQVAGIMDCSTETVRVWRLKFRALNSASQNNQA